MLSSYNAYQIQRRKTFCSSSLILPTSSSTIVSLRPNCSNAVQGRCPLEIIHYSTYLHINKYISLEKFVFITERTHNQEDPRESSVRLCREQAYFSAQFQVRDIAICPSSLLRSCQPSLNIRCLQVDLLFPGTISWISPYSRHTNEYVSRLENLFKSYVFNVKWTSVDEFLRNIRQMTAGSHVCFASALDCSLTFMDLNVL